MAKKKQAKAVKKKKRKPLKYDRIVIELRFTDGEIDIKEFATVEEMFGLLEDVFFEKGDYLDAVRIELS